MEFKKAIVIVGSTKERRQEELSKRIEEYNPEHTVLIRGDKNMKDLGAAISCWLKETTEVLAVHELPKRLLGAILSAANSTVIVNPQCKPRFTMECPPVFLTMEGSSDYILALPPSYQRRVELVDLGSDQKTEQFTPEQIQEWKKKAQKWDNLYKEVSKFYCNADGEYDEENPEMEGDLGSIGEVAASRLGWL